MHAELSFPVAELTAFLLVLSRIVGVFVFLPLPGKEAGPSAPRIVFSFATAISVFQFWPWKNMAEPVLGRLIFWLCSELALGLTLGLIVGFLAEALTVGAHVLALQAGYAYASVIDPTTQADSDVMQVLAQLMGGLLFFSFRLDHMAVRTFVYSLKTFPPGQFGLTSLFAKEVTNIAVGIFTVALRLSLPTVALLLTTEVALAIAGRMSAQLQLGSHASSVKMLLTLLALASSIRVVPILYEAYAAQVYGFLRSNFWTQALAFTH